MSRSWSKLPSPRLAIANDASTSAWPRSARLAAVPFNDGAIANPIASHRALMSEAATIAATALPPADRTLSAAN